MNKEAILQEAYDSALKDELEKVGVSKAKQGAALIQRIVGSKAVSKEGKGDLLKGITRHMKRSSMKARAKPLKKSEAKLMDRLKLKKKMSSEVERKLLR